MRKLLKTIKDCWKQIDWDQIWRWALLEGAFGLVMLGIGVSAGELRAECKMLKKAAEQAPPAIEARPGLK